MEMIVMVLFKSGIIIEWLMQPNVALKPWRSYRKTSLYKVRSSKIYMRATESWAEIQITNVIKDTHLLLSLSLLQVWELPDFYICSWDAGVFRTRPLWRGFAADGEKNRSSCKKGEQRGETWSSRGKRHPASVALASIDDEIPQHFFGTKNNPHPVPLAGLMTMTALPSSS